MEKLRIFRTSLIYLILFFDTVTCIIYVERGKSVTLNPTIKGTPENILWTHNGNKAAEFDLQFNAFKDYGQFKGRAQINISTGQLTVHQMTSDDNGVYTSLIEINGLLQHSTYEIKVIDPVSEPRVTCELNSKSESRTLFCSVTSESVTAYEWTGPNALQHSGQELHISQEEDSNSVYICTVKNEVSHNSTSFTLQDCNTDSAQLGLNVLLPAAICGAVLVVIILVAIYFIRRRKNKMIGGSGDDTVIENREENENLLTDRSGPSCAQSPIKKGHVRNMTNLFETPETNTMKTDRSDYLTKGNNAGLTYHNKKTELNKVCQRADKINEVKSSECAEEEVKQDLNEKDLKGQSEQDSDSEERTENKAQKKSEDGMRMKEEADRTSSENESFEDTFDDLGNIQRDPNEKDANVENDEQEKSEDETSHESKDRDEEEANRMNRESDSDENSKCDAGNIQNNPNDKDSQSESDQTPESVKKGHIRNLTKLFETPETNTMKTDRSDYLTKNITQSYTDDVGTQEQEVAKDEKTENINKDCKLDVSSDKNFKKDLNVESEEESGYQSEQNSGSDNSTQSCSDDAGTQKQEISEDGVEAMAKDEATENVKKDGKLDESLDKNIKKDLNVKSEEESGDQSEQSSGSEAQERSVINKEKKGQHQDNSRKCCVGVAEETKGSIGESED